MKYVSTELLENLTAQAEQNIAVAIGEWQLLPTEFFSAQPGINQWSAAQCLEHLNSYGRYYLPAIEKAIANAAHARFSGQFKSGLLGNYFYKLMLTDNKGNVKKKMKAPKDHRPAAVLNVAQVLSEFISQQEKLLQLIGNAATINLAGVRVPISISPFIKLKLGDTFLFYTAHLQRHIMQASRALQVAGYLPPVNTNPLV